MNESLQALESTALTNSVDAFILFNELENEVVQVVQAFEEQGVRTYLWRRDISHGKPWQDIEQQKFANARVVVLFLGKAGWGPTHLQLAEEAERLNKYIIPVILSDLSQEAKTGANGLFSRLRYFDLRNRSSETISNLVHVVLNILKNIGSTSTNNLASDLPILPVETATSASIQSDSDSLNSSLATYSEADKDFDYVINVFINGDQPTRFRELEVIRTSHSLNRYALAKRLRVEIEGRFSVNSEKEFSSAFRAPNETPLIRSWLLNALVWCNAEEIESRALLLKHLDALVETYTNARFWILGGLYQRGASYVIEAATRCLNDPEAQVLTLARVIHLPPNPENTEEFSQILHLVESPDVATAWPVLRALRVVPIPILAKAVCRQFIRMEENSSYGYDALYALVSPSIAQAAVDLLLGPLNSTLDQVVRRVVLYTRGANATAIKDFAGFLSRFNGAGVELALAHIQQDPDIGPTARELQRNLRDYNSVSTAIASNQLPGYQADTNDTTNDHLGIQEDVHTLTAVILARDIHPPLAIGLFGDWGSGKSFFMKSMRQVTQQLTQQAAADPSSSFCSDVVSIEFNAWHYVDTNLWASLVSFILEKLDAYVSPVPSTDDEITTTSLELELAQGAVTKAEAEKGRVEGQITERRQKLVQLQREREGKQIQLSDLRWRDFKNTLSLKDRQTIESASQRLGIPNALASLEELTQAAVESATLGARVQALFRAVVSSRSMWLLLGLLIVVMVAIPMLLNGIQENLPVGRLLDWGAGQIVNFIAFITGLTSILQGAIKKVAAYVQAIEGAKYKVELFLNSRNQAPTAEEMTLQHDIEELVTQEQTAAAGLSAAEARVVALEERIRSLKERQSLAHFLTERSQSDDYRKHLGLISTIRRDFEHLADRLKKGSKSEHSAGSVDRIVLYIDDLDRCPTHKVIEVLQAIHLLLAHELFVVVVGVDPRWLLHSLHRNFTPLQSEEEITASPLDDWHTTPQNYLEKIFQIPFSLRPMAQGGYRQLMSSLLMPSGSKSLTSTSTNRPLDFETKPEVTMPQTMDTSAVVIDELPLQPMQERLASTGAKQIAAGASMVIPNIALTIRSWETEFAGELFELIPTPRAAKRFTNIYRLLKAQVHTAQLVQFEGSAAQPGDFQVAMVLLAILIGCPKEAASIFLNLQKHARAQDKVSEVWTGIHEIETKSNELQRIANCARSLMENPRFPQNSAIYQEWLPRVARFSFELGHIILPASPLN